MRRDRGALDTENLLVAWVAGEGKDKWRVLSNLYRKPMHGFGRLYFCSQSPRQELGALSFEHVFSNSTDVVSLRDWSVSALWASAAEQWSLGAG